MRAPVPVLFAVSALTLAACVPPGVHQPRLGAALKPVSRLNCPDSQGELTRTSASPDGQSCAYQSGSETVVQMKLVKVSGDPDATLSPIESDLRKLATFDAAAPPASDAPIEAQPGAHSNVNINLPGIQIHASDQKANIRVAGIHVDADDRTNSAHIQGGHALMGGRGNFSIDANNSGAIIRSRSIGPNVNQALILASEHPGPEGWRAVGYEAQGPRSGPLVVAIVQSRSGEHDRLFQDVKALVHKSAAD
jgi:hypothetical protein